MAGLTLVTSLFDLKRREASARRGIEDYFRVGEFLLGLDQDIIVFCDPELAERLWKDRCGRGYAKRTHIAAVTFEALSTAKYSESIKRGRPAGNRNAVKDSAGYTVLGWSKFELIERAAALNPFGASHLAWIDFGIAHVAKLDDHTSVEPFANPPEKVRMHMLKYFDENDVREHAYWDFRRGHLAGGFFIGGVQDMLAFSAAFWPMAETALANEYSPTEDCVMPVIAGRQRNRFSFSYGDYEDVLRNHVRVRGGGPELLFQMKNASARQAWHHSIAIGREVVVGHQQGVFKCKEGVLEDLIMEYYIAANNSRAENDAKNAALYYADLAGKNPSFRSVYLSRHEFVQKHFSGLVEPVLLPKE